jgi:hypothetical protein
MLLLVLLLLVLLLLLLILTQIQTSSLERTSWLPKFFSAAQNFAFNYGHPVVFAINTVTSVPSYTHTQLVFLLLLC